MGAPRRLGRDFFAGPTVAVARALLGAYVVHAPRAGAARAGRIVETEAYCGPDDQASHARFGPTPRARLMFGPPGHAYVYLVYGRNHCLNLVTEPAGCPAAVLLRAIEPAEGVAGPANGPGLLCRALGVDLTHNGLDVCARGAALFVEDRGEPPPAVGVSARAGVAYAGEWAARPWRFFIPGNPHVSRRPGLPR
ncbi:MAG TPA: DNA-3-methyladenine glycosylase [Polyangia bacterium]|jgi:DNA-3-methyladenine glycosylase